MTKTSFMIFITFILLTIFSGSSFAESKDSNNEAIETVNNPALTAQSNSSQKTFSMLRELMNKIDKQEQRHLFMIYNNYNLIEAVKTVQTDISKTITGCSQNNPDMKNRLEKRFVLWDSTVTPVLEEAKGHLNNMVIAQSYAKSKDIKAIFTSVDKTRKDTATRLDKVHVTTKDACKFLLKKIDKTQDTMISILKSTLVNTPQTYQEEEQKQNQSIAPDE